MAEFLKPQSPLKHKDGAFLYPLTTADQVILEDNNRLNFALEHLVYVDEEHQESAVASLDADTLGGHPVEDFLRPKAGFIYPLAGSVIPDGFLLCDGAEYGRTEFPELFAAIGTIYGNGDGSTTFNVPNLQTRVPVGAGEGYGLGSTGGEATHTLTVDEMPAHNHNTAVQIYSNSSGSASLSGNASGASMNGVVGTTGGSQPHNNMQPYTVVNYIIATGKDTGVSVSDVVLGAQAIPLGVEYGGTGATNAADALKNLGAVPKSDTGWLSTPNGYFDYRHKNGIVYIRNTADFPSVAAQTWGTIDSIPSQYAPKTQLVFPTLSTSSLNTPSNVMITWDGVIKVWCASAAITNCSGCFSYPI